MAAGATYVANGNCSHGRRCRGIGDRRGRWPLVQEFDAIILRAGGRPLIEKLDILVRRRTPIVEGFDIFFRLIRRRTSIVERFDVCFRILAHLLDGWLFFLLRPSHERAWQVLTCADETAAAGEPAGTSDATSPEIHANEATTIVAIQSPNCSQLLTIPPAWTPRPVARRLSFRESPHAAYRT